MNGYEYEQACAAYLRKKGFRRVEVTQASRDQGADILAVRKKEKYAFQCKYYATPVGNKAVQEVYAAATFYGCDRAVVMTNNTFTKGAIELAESLGVELMPGIEPKKRRFGFVTVLMLLAEVIAAGLLCMVLLEPDSPPALAAFREDYIQPYGNAILVSAGLTAVGCLLYFARWYPSAAVLCLCGAFGFLLFPDSVSGWTYVMMAAGLTGVVSSLFRAIASEYTRVFRKPEDGEDEASAGSEELQDEGEESAASGECGRETDPDEDPGANNPSSDAAGNREALSLLYDLVGIAERSLHDTADPNERREILETLGEAYNFLIAHEAEIPEEWESPQERLQQLEQTTGEDNKSRGEPL